MEEENKIKYPITQIVDAPKYFRTGNENDTEIEKQLHVIDFTPPLEETKK